MDRMTSAMAGTSSSLLDPLVRAEVVMAVFEVGVMRLGDFDVP
jgi:hypothetical protein